MAVCAAGGGIIMWQCVQQAVGSLCGSVCSRRVGSLCGCVQQVGGIIIWQSLQQGFGS